MITKVRCKKIIFPLENPLTALIKFLDHFIVIKTTQYECQNKIMNLAFNS